MSSTEQQELQQLLSDAVVPNGKPRGQHPGDALASPVKTEKDTLEHCQWEVLPNGVFMATGTTKPRLSPGAYTVGITDSGRVLFISKRILTDTLIDLDDSTSIKVIEGIRKFWTKKAKYQERGLLFRRGVLLWGPPGGGKTATVALLVQDIIRMGGIVLLVQNPAFATRALPVLRHIEPDRPFILILEDVEEITQNYGEHDLLALLDGEHQTDNTVNIATTNYPENLGARIINRPSRFDEVLKIGMRSAGMRQQYLWHILGADAEKYPVASWVRQTEGMSIAHLKELVIAVTCLEQDENIVIERLKSMKTTPKSQMYDGKVGFGGQNLASSPGGMNTSSSR